MDWAVEPKVENDRTKGIGSSDMPIIMGVSPWSDVYTLWLEKTGQLPEEKKFKGNFATERGQRLEPIAREKYEMITGFKFPAENMVHKNVPEFRVSFDGINHEIKRIIEIKCPGKVSHAKALEGKVPEVYWPQVQWQLMIAGPEYTLDYISWDGEESFKIIPVFHNTEYQQKLLDEASKFWGYVTRREPPPTNEVEITDQNLVELLFKREKLKAEIDALTAAYDIVNDSIKTLATAEETHCNGWKIKWTEVKGNVDYGKIPELKGVDLDSYRKAPTKRLNITKEK